MLDSFKYGLSAAGRKSILIVILFLYEMLWGFLLYRYVKSVIVPLLYRYPGSEVPNWSSLFWIEGEFRMMKTDMASVYIWTLLSMLFIRLIVTPLINAGLFHAIHRASEDQWRAFRTGIRTLWGKFFILYGVQMVITLAPLYWFIPRMFNMLQNGSFSTFGLMDGVLILISYIAYIAMIRLCFMYLQFAAASGEAWGSALLIWVKKLFPLIGLSLCIVLIAIVFQGVLAAASMLWAGLTALIIYQATPFVRVWFQVWEIAAQHDLWLKSHK